MNRKKRGQALSLSQILYKKRLRKKRHSAALIQGHKTFRLLNNGFKQYEYNYGYGDFNRSCLLYGVFVNGKPLLKVPIKNS